MPVTEEYICARLEGALDGCWLWTSHINRDGYAKAWDGRLVHRILYEWCVDDIPEGYELDHLCRVRHCCNPEHVEPVLHIENVRRGRSHQREMTECLRGHPLSGENVYLHGGKRHCRTCQRMHVRAYRLRRRAA